MIARPAGLRAKALVLVGAVLFASAAYDLYFSFQRRDAAIAEATARVERLTLRVAEQQAKVVTLVGDFGRLVMEVGNVAQLAAERRCPSSFARLVREDARIGNIVLAGESGELLCLAEGSPAGINIADRPYFRHALQAPDFIIGEPIVGRATGRWSIPLARALRDPQGRAHGVFIVLLDLKWLERELARAALPTGARVGIADSHGRVLARYPDPDRWVGRDASRTPFFADLLKIGGTGTGESVGFDGVPRVYGFARFAETSSGPLYLWAGVDKAAVVAEANAEFAKSIGFAVLLFALSFGAIWWGGARLLEPLRVTTEAARRLAQGDYGARAIARYGNDEIGQLARSFNTMASALEERTRLLKAANAELEAFSYSVSHDLRAPLRSIDGFSQAILEDYGGKLDAQGEQYLQRLRLAAQRMGQLIDDILRLSRATRLEMKPRQVDLAELAREIVADLHKGEPARNVTLKAPPQLVAYGDPGLLRVALDNLLGNAWKFTSKTAQAEIEIGEARVGGEPRYFVRDNGAGFDMTYAKNLFTAFQRLHQPGEFPGTGIGLATVKRIIERHGGRVAADGAPGRGAVFFFTLPADRREPSDARYQAENPPRRGQRGRRSADAARAEEEQYS